MDASHKTQILMSVKAHFSKATEGDGELVWEDVKGYSLQDAIDAIVAHRRECGKQAWRPDPKRVKQIAFNSHRERQRAKFAGQRIVDGIRMTGQEAYYGKGEAEVILLHFSACWKAVKESGAPENGIRAAKAYIYNHAKRAAMEIGENEQNAEEFAREIIGLAVGEKIMRAPAAMADTFQKEESIKTSWEQLKALVVDGNNRDGSGI